MGRNRRRDECVETPTRVFVRVFSFSSAKHSVGKTDYWSATRISKFLGGLCVWLRRLPVCLLWDHNQIFTFNFAIVQIRRACVTRRYYPLVNYWNYIA